MLLLEVVGVVNVVVIIFVAVVVCRPVGGRLGASVPSWAGDTGEGPYQGPFDTLGLDEPLNLKPYP